MKRFDSATCPNCQTFYDRLPVDGDEDGNAWVALESKPCQTCGQMLCPNCEQFVCEHGETHCQSHLTVVADGTPRGLMACPVCLEQIAESDTQPALPALGVCVDCELPVEAFSASVQRGGDVWHTACFNAMQEYYRQMAEEHDDSEGFRHLTDAAYPARRDVERETRTVVERWIDGRWTEVTLYWDGAAYVERQAAGIAKSA